MNKVYIVIYLVLILTIFLLFLIWRDMSDTLMFILAAFGLVITSIFTYSRRK